MDELLYPLRELVLAAGLLIPALLRGQDRHTLTCGLRFIHGRVGLADELVRAHLAPASEGDTDARTQLNALAGNGDLPVE